MSFRSTLVLRLSQSWQLKHDATNDYTQLIRQQYKEVIRFQISSMLKQREDPYKHPHYKLLPPFQNVGRFDFSRFIYFAMYLDICYI